MYPPPHMTCVDTQYPCQYICWYIYLHIYLVMNTDV